MKKNIYIVPVTIVENQATIQTHICAGSTIPGAQYGGGNDPNDPDLPDNPPGGGSDGPGVGGDFTKKRNSDFGSIW